MASPNAPPDELASNGTARNANGPEVPKLRARGLGAMLVIQGFVRPDVHREAILQTRRRRAEYVRPTTFATLVPDGRQMSGGSHLTATAHGRNETRALRLMPSAEVKSGTLTSKLRESMLNGLAEARWQIELAGTHSPVSASCSALQRSFTILISIPENAPPRSAV